MSSWMIADPQREFNHQTFVFLVCLMHAGTKAFGFPFIFPQDPDQFQALHRFQYWT